MNRRQWKGGKSRNGQWAYLIILLVCFCGLWVLFSGDSESDMRGKRQRLAEERLKNLSRNPYKSSEENLKEKIRSAVAKQKQKLPKKLKHVLKDGSETGEAALQALRENVNTRKKALHDLTHFRQSDETRDDDYNLPVRGRAGAIELGEEAINKDKQQLQEEESKIRGRGRPELSDSNGNADSAKSEEDLQEQEKAALRQWQEQKLRQKAQRRT